MKKTTCSFTILELLIILALIMTLMTVGFIAINPKEQFARSKDAIRKNDLHTLRTMFEDWKNDKGCYPKLADICYTNESSTTCKICSTHAQSPSLLPYAHNALCDPESPNTDYLYQIQGDVNCPSAYLVYTKLKASYVQSNDIYNCTELHACGPAPGFGYDYLVSSPNASIPVAGNFYCISSKYKCIGCGTMQQCTTEVERGTCVTVYTSKTNCCSANPGAGFCS